MTVHYRVALTQTDEGVSISVPGLPGCWSQGRDEHEALENIQDAIRAYLVVAEQQLQGADIREIELTV